MNKFLDKAGLAHFWYRVKSYIDENGSSGSEAGGAEEVYSTEETRIGTWIDGKPLYRIVFLIEEWDFEMEANKVKQFEANLPASLKNKIILRNAYGRLDDMYNFPGVIPYFISTPVYVTINIDITGDTIRFMTYCDNSSAANYFKNIDGWLTFEYTKTTD